LLENVGIQTSEKAVDEIGYEHHYCTEKASQSPKTNRVLYYFYLNKIILKMVENGGNKNC